MPDFRYSKPVSKIDEVFPGMGGVVGANAQTPQNWPMYVQQLRAQPAAAATGPAPGKNSQYGSVGQDGQPVRSPTVRDHAPFNPFKPGTMERKHA
jgi:hypothetical protein